MNEICIEECSPKSDCSSFELKDISLPEAPQYPDTSKMTWKERFVVQEAYTKLTIDFIQGRKAFANVDSPNFPGRSISRGPRHNGNPETQKVEGFPVSQNRDQALQGQEERPSTNVLAPKVD